MVILIYRFRVILLQFETGEYGLRRILSLYVGSRGRRSLLTHDVRTLDVLGLKMMDVMKIDHAKARGSFVFVC